MHFILDTMLLSKWISLFIFELNVFEFKHHAHSYVIPLTQCSFLYVYSTYINYLEIITQQLKYTMQFTNC